MSFNDSKYNQSWVTEKISDMGVFARGVSKHRPRDDKRLFENGKYPLVQTSQVKNAVLYLNSHQQMYGEFGLRQSKLWKAGTLCITIAANIAETAVIEYPMCFPDSVVGFTATPEKTSEVFVYYLFSSMRQMIQNSASGSSQANINLAYLSKLDFRFPSKAEQDRIEKILSSLDKKIICNNNTSRDLEKFVQLVYDYWFVQFDFPDENGKPYKSSGGKMVWNEELKREIPEGWEVDSIEALISEREKSSVQVGEAIGHYGNVPFFTSGDEIIMYDTALTSGKNCFLNTGGNADVKYYIGDAAYSTDTWCITAGEYSSYLYGYIDSIRKYLDISFFAGSGLKHLQKDSFKSHKIIIPPSRLIKKFNETADRCFIMISEAKIENQTLSELRDFLLPMLMNGQVKVGETKE